MTPKDFHVGQTVYVERYRSKDEPEAVEVTKIGRQWVTIGSSWREQRFNPRTMRLDTGGGSPQAVWLSLEGREQDRRREEAWRMFQDRVRHQYVAPRGIATSTVKRWIAEFDAAKSSGAPSLQSEPKASAGNSGLDEPLPPALPYSAASRP